MGSGSQKKSRAAKKPLASKRATEVTSDRQTAGAETAQPAETASAEAQPATETTAAPAEAAPATEAGSTKVMEITLKRSDKQRSTQMVVYTVDERPGSVRFSKTLFKDKAAPPEVTLQSDAFAGPKEPKRVETKEERKARLAALPKPTAAEKLARLEAKIAKLRPKVEAEASKTEGGEATGENASA